MLKIAPESPVSDDGRKLIAGSEAALRDVYPPESCFSFTAEELLAPGSSFFVARRDGRPVGCVALVDCGVYGEIKRLFVLPGERRNGTARALMARLETAARQAGLPVVRLETGERLAAAVRLYERLRYRRCGSFGPYENHPDSLFMEKALR